MSRTIGEVIRKLRKELNYTQEELAEQLNISGQSVSKWENGTSLPDISQVVPLATVLGVSTDVLFDFSGKSDTDAVNEIIKQANDLVYDKNYCVTKEGLYKAYLKEQDGLKIYPNNTTLLLQHLETGISLAYPENDCYDSIHAAEIYKECIRSANIVVRYGKDTTDVLRANMIMVLLHSAFGNFEKAREHAEQFPFRADMTINKMMSYIEHFNKAYKLETINCQNDIWFHLEALLDTIMQNGIAQMKLKEYDNAIETFSSIFKIAAAIFPDEKYQTVLHSREKDDAHLLIAEAYTIKGEYEEAVKWLKRMFDFETKIRTQYSTDMKVKSSLTKDSNFIPFRRHRTTKGYLGKMIELFKADRFKQLEDTDSYKALLTELEREYQKSVQSF